LKIYIFGSKSFKKEMLSLMEKSNLLDITNEIDNIELLEETIKKHPKDIYLIDSDKIISKNIITDKLKLKSKDTIYKQTLEKFGIDDMCFNSNEALLNYIIDKIDRQDIITNSDDEICIEERNMNDITQIDDIPENELLIALNQSDANDISTVNNNNNHDIITDKVLSNDKIEITNDNLHDVSELLKQLLNNKTVELSIKIKD
jgi:hypothetical protein